VGLLLLSSQAVMLPLPMQRATSLHVVEYAANSFSGCCLLSHACGTSGASAAAASSAPAASKSSKPEKEKKEKAAPKKPAAAAGEAEGPVGKLPTAKSAYMMFADDKRAEVKGESTLLSIKLYRCASTVMLQQLPFSRC
jgi:hypothetical protein